MSFHAALVVHKWLDAVIIHRNPQMATCTSATGYTPSQFVRIAVQYFRDLYNRVLVFVMPDNVREERLHHSDVFVVAILGLPLSNGNQRGLTNLQKSCLVNCQYPCCV